MVEQIESSRDMGGDVIVNQIMGKNKKQKN